MDTIKVQTPDGGWWDIKSWLTRGDRRKIDQHVQDRAIEQVQRFQKLNMSLEQLRDIAGAPQNPGTSPDEEDAMLVYCTVTWSYGDDITPEAIAEKPDKATSVVLAKMHELYDFAGEELKKSGA